MAEHVVSVVVQKLADYLQKEASLLYGVRDEVGWLERELRGMLCFLKDADSKRKGNDERVKNWVRDVREVAYEAEDIIDDFVLKVGRYASFNRGMYQLTSTIPRYKISKKIEKIKTRIKEISDRRATYGIANIGEIEGEGGRFLDENIEARRRLSPHYYDDTSIVGLEEDKNMILKQLFNDEKRRCVISIIGMGGLGKTTLAKKVYNSSEVIAEFPCRVWVSVSQDYRVTELLKKIIEDIEGKQDTENLDEEKLKEKLYRLLQNQRRYLIVMDDVWRQEVWERVDTAFYDAQNGSRVIFTTRQKEVAKHADPTTTPYELPLLNQAESRELLLKKAYPYEDIQKFPGDLEDIGEKLVSKCHGLPLALVVLGGLLSRREKSPCIWLRVLNSSDWQTTEGCRPILSLSYEDLSYQLKSCFLYIGSFPEDSEINTKRLIRLWIAEGFVTERPQKTRTETATDYLDELIQRCMVQVASRGVDGILSCICIHDLLRDLCLAEAREVGFLMVRNEQIGDTSTASNVITARRLAQHNHIDFSYLISSMEHMSRKKLRTLLAFNLTKGDVVLGKTIRDALNDLRLLRVIDVGIVRLERPILTRFSKEISAMIHLRYLRLRCASKLLLPYVGNLRNLQTLDVEGAFSGSNSGIGNLKDLQELSSITAGPWIQRDLAKLTNLCRLRIVDISPHDEQALVRSLRELHRLEFLDLRGLMWIRAEPLAVLSNHDRLRELHLAGPFSRLSYSGSGLLPNLSFLVLKGSQLMQDPMAVLENLPNLLELQLSWNSFVGRSMCCSAGGFSRLQRMILDFLPELEEWRVEAGAMPCLTHLSIADCHKLKVLPEGLQHVTTLQELMMWGMPGELAERVGKEEGEDWYKIRHVPNVKIH